MVFNLQQSHPYCLAFTYAIDKSECNVYQDVNRENLTISFSNEKCVSNETNESAVYYSLTLQLTNDAIIVTGPEKITMECRVRKVVSEVFLSRSGSSASILIRLDFFDAMSRETWKRYIHSDCPWFLAVITVGLQLSREKAVKHVNSCVQFCILVGFFKFNFFLINPNRDKIRLKCKAEHMIWHLSQPFPD